jgi:hypothetical protein
VKKSQDEQKPLAQRRKGAEVEAKKRSCLFRNRCASASLREIVYFFTDRGLFSCPMLELQVVNREGTRRYRCPAKLSLL